MAVNRQAAIAAAEKLVSRGKIEAAIKEYRKLLADNPNDASTLNRLGDLYVRLARIDEAVKLFAQIADRYGEDGFFVKAIAIYKKIIKLDPTRLAVYERLAELYHKQGLVTEARTQYQVLVDYYQKHSNPTAAISVLHRMVELEPEDPTPHLKLSEIHHQLQQGDKELAEYRTIAELMVRHGRIDEATQVFMKAIAAAPNDLAFVTDAVLGLKDGGHTAAAARLLALAVEKNPQAEKIARLAGLSRRDRPGAAAEPEPRVITVNELIGGPPPVERTGVRPIPPPPPAPPKEVLELDERLLEGALAEPVPIEVPPVVPFDEEIVLELPEEGLPAPSLSAPAVELPRGKSEPAWFESEVPEIEFELEIEGLEAPPPAVEAEPPSAPAPASPRPFEVGMEPGGEAFEIDWQFEPEPELAVEMPPPAAAEPAAAAPAASAPGAVADAARTTRPLDLEELEKTSYEVERRVVPAARRLEDLLAEAEVFAKYGLREKAHDRAREILQLQPRNVGALALQVTLWLEEGKHERVLQRVGALAQAAAEARETETWAQVRQRLAKAGYQVEGDRVVGAPAPKRPQKDSVAALLEDLVGPRTAAKPAAAKSKAPAPPDALAALEAEIGRGAPPRPAAKRPAAPVAAPAPALAATPVAPAPAAPPPRPAPPPMPVAGAPAEAEEPPRIVVPRGPGRGAPAPPPVAAEKTADDGLAWLDQVSTPIGGSKPDEALFEDEEGFFDLAAELEQELTKEDLLAGKALVPAQEQSLEEIVEGFKKGVAESLSPEDFDTHFNLGIAYREMGLLDEAIGEFQLAAKDAKYLLDCCSLLGACFLEKGLPELAVKWYQKGLETPDLSEEATLGLLYDLGNLYASVGETDRARKTFVEIYGVNSNYRDVVARLEELGD